MAKFGFNLNEYENSRGGGSREPLPDGKYLLAGEKADQQDTANGEGINAMFDVLDGEYAGRKVFIFFNTVNKSEMAQKIGREQLATWARACGKPGADDTDKLLGLPFMAELYTEPSKDPKYGPSNRIGKWFMKDGSEPPNADGKPAASSTGSKPAAETKPKTPAVPAGGKKNPWDD